MEQQFLFHLPHAVSIPSPPYSFYSTSPCSFYSIFPIQFLFHLPHAVSIPPPPYSFYSTSPMQFLFHLPHTVSIPPPPCSFYSISPMQFLFHLPHRHCTSSAVDAYTYIVKRGTIQTVPPFCLSTCTRLLTPTKHITICIYT